jgi:hypothetical protein
VASLEAGSSSRTTTRAVTSATMRAPCRWPAPAGRRGRACAACRVANFHDRQYPSARGSVDCGAVHTQILTQVLKVRRTDSCGRARCFARRPQWLETRMCWRETLGLMLVASVIGAFGRYPLLLQRLGGRPLGLPTPTPS